MADLTAAERRWLQNAPARTRISTGAIDRATSRFLENVALLAAGIGNATSTIPPQSRGQHTGRRGSDVSDPALSAITSTWHAIDVALTRLGHLLDDCHLCDAHNPGPGHNETPLTLAAVTGTDLTEASDHLTGLGPGSPHAIADVVPDACKLAAIVATRFRDRWHDDWRDGAESDDLRQRIDDMARLAGRASGAAASVAQWTGFQGRFCKAGCGAPAPHLPATAQERGGAVCQRCAKRLSRQRQEGAA